MRALLESGFGVEAILKTNTGYVQAQFFYYDLSITKIML